MKTRQLSTFGVVGALAAIAALLGVCAASACAPRERGPEANVAPAASGIVNDGELAAAVDALIDAEFSVHPMAGVSVAAARGGELLLARGYGSADLENDVQASHETVYRIGSITKQFTAAAILQLVENGEVNLDDELGRFLPDFPTQGNRVTVRHLLNHTSGIKSYTGLGPEWLETVPLDLSHEELLALIVDKPFDFAPGERYLYNNSGYYLLGRIIEEVSGMTYTEYLERSVFSKAALESTYYCDNQPIISRRAEGYEVDAGELVNDDLIGMRQPFSAGALCSTVTDLVRWTQALASGQVVSQESYRLMTTAGTLNDGSELEYGFGLGIGEFEGHRRIAHGGGINGFLSMLSYYPDDGVIITVLTNTGSSHPGALEQAVARLALGIDPPEVLDLAVEPQATDAYAGTYARPQLSVTVEARDGQLHVGMLGSPPARLLYQGDDRFVAKEHVHVSFRFETDDDGAVVAVVVSPGGRLPRIPEQ